MEKGRDGWKGAVLLLLALVVLGGCTRKKFPQTRIASATFQDVNNNGFVDDGDRLVVTFIRPVVVNSPDPASFSLPVDLDTLGSSATVIQTKVLLIHSVASSPNHCGWATIPSKTGTVTDWTIILAFPDFEAA